MVFVGGSRHSGKTTLAKNIAQIVANLKKPDVDGITQVISPLNCFQPLWDF
jgi:uridine kinase